MMHAGGHQLEGCGFPNVAEANGLRPNPKLRLPSGEGMRVKGDVSSLETIAQPSGGSFLVALDKTDTSRNYCRTIGDARSASVARVFTMCSLSVFIIGLPSEFKSVEL
jgi:hypothetical protein